MTENKRYTKSEELANAISHLAGAGLATAGLVLMIIFSAIRGDAWHIVTTSVFGATMVLLYLSSGFMHALRPGKFKAIFLKIDRIAIFLLIAGTYTPLTLVVVGGRLGWTLFGIEWAIAAAGIILTFSPAARPEIRVNYLFVAMYVIMGWLLLVALIPVIRSISTAGALWILAGGVLYSIGIYFYAKAKFRYHHLVWHLFVIAGSLSHFFAIFFHVIPEK
jgi:hemolysin III